MKIFGVTVERKRRERRSGECRSGECRSGARGRGALIALLLVLSAGLQAQVKTLEEAESIVLSNALQIQIAEQGVEKARIGFREAVGTVLPTISAYGQATTNQELPSIIIDFDGPGPQPATAIPMGSKYSNTAGFSLSQPLFTGGAVLAGFRIARESVEMSRINEQMTRDNTIMTLRTLWYQLLLTRSLIEATEWGLESATANFELAQKKFNAGTASQFEVLQAQVNMEQLKPTLIQLRNQLRSVKTNLLAYINDPAVREIEPSGKLTPEEDPFVGLDLEGLVAKALRQRPELQLLESQRSILEQQRNIAYGQVLPMLSFSADIRHQGQDDVKDDLNYLRSRSSSLNLSVPIFSGGRKVAAIQSARVALKEAELQYEQTLTYLRTELESNYYKVDESRQSIEANAALVEQAEEALRMAKLSYESGASTQLEIQNAQSAVLQATGAYLSSVFQYNLALNNLKKSLNQL